VGFADDFSIFNLVSNSLRNIEKQGVTSILHVPLVSDDDAPD
jgi:hypothetical protein